MMLIRALKVYVKRSVMVMEPMAEVSLGAREGFEKGKFRAGIRGKSAGVKRKRQDESSADERDEQQKDNAPDKAGEPVEVQSKTKRKAWGSKGPNPLSVKKRRKAKDNKEAVAHDGMQTSMALVEVETNGSLDATEDGPNIIARSQNQHQDPPARRKRKRKQKTNKLEELKTVMQEASDREVISP